MDAPRVLDEGAYARAGGVGVSEPTAFEALLIRERGPDGKTVGWVVHIVTPGGTMQLDADEFFSLADELRDAYEARKGS